MTVVVPLLVGVAAVDYVFDFGWLRCLKDAITCRHCCHSHEESSCCVPDVEPSTEKAEG